MHNIPTTQDTTVCLKCGDQFQSNGNDRCNWCNVGSSVQSVTCTHEWVWSGVPRGSSWCKKCDIDHNESAHGVLKDLSRRTYV